MQVTKVTISTKGPSITTESSLAGRYLGLMALQRAERYLAQDRVTRTRPRARPFDMDLATPCRKKGVIVRTVGEGQRALFRGANRCFVEAMARDRRSDEEQPRRY